MTDCLASTGTNQIIPALLAVVLIICGVLIARWCGFARTYTVLVVVLTYSMTGSPAHAATGVFSDCAQDTTNRPVLAGDGSTSTTVARTPPVVQNIVAFSQVDQLSGTPQTPSYMTTLFTLYLSDDGLGGYIIDGAISGPAHAPLSFPLTPTSYVINDTFLDSAVASDGAIIDPETVDLQPSVPGIQHTATIMVGTETPTPLTITYDPLTKSLLAEQDIDITTAFGTSVSATVAGFQPIQDSVGTIRYTVRDSYGNMSNEATISFSFDIPVSGGF